MDTMLGLPRGGCMGGGYQLATRTIYLVRVHVVVVASVSLGRNTDINDKQCSNVSILFGALFGSSRVNTCMYLLNVQPP